MTEISIHKRHNDYIYTGKFTDPDPDTTLSLHATIDTVQARHSRPATSEITINQRITSLAFIIFTKLELTGIYELQSGVWTSASPTTATRIRMITTKSALPKRTNKFNTHLRIVTCFYIYFSTFPFSAFVDHV